MFLKHVSSINGSLLTVFPHSTLHTTKVTKKLSLLKDFYTESVWL